MIKVFVAHFFSFLLFIVSICDFFGREEVGGGIILYLFALLFTRIYAIEDSLEIGVIFN